MTHYVLKRLLWFIPTLFIVTIIGFLLLASVPGDAVNSMVMSSGSGGSIKTTKDIETQKMYWRKQLGLDLPLFYFSVTTLSEPDTLYKIYDEQKLKTYKTLLKLSGNPKTIDKYLNQLHKTDELFNTELLHLQHDSAHIYLPEDKELINHINVSLQQLKFHSSVQQSQNNIQIINELAKIISPDFLQQATLLASSYSELLSNKTIYKNFIPKLIWYGHNNQYHRWLFGNETSKGMIRGDFGLSISKKEPVIFILKDKLIWSLFFSISSILLAYLISIPIGIKMATNPDSTFSKTSHYILFLLYAMPSFFVGVLLLMLFANPDVLAIFPPSGVKPIEGYDTGASLFSKFYVSLPYIILPLICYTYSSLAFISKLTATSISGQLQLDYIRTAKAKGLSSKTVIWKHALKNSALPLITVFSSVFPSVIGGSVIIESIFTIPGMGLETVRAVIAHDYPVVIAVITLSSLLTILCYLLADILYAWVDPRIRT